MCQIGNSQIYLDKLLSTWSGSTRPAAVALRRPAGLVVIATNAIMKSGEIDMKKFTLAAAHSLR